MSYSLIPAGVYPREGGGGEDNANYSVTVMLDLIRHPA